MKSKTSDELLMNIYDFVSTIIFGMGLVSMLGGYHFFVKNIGFDFSGRI
jgi:hypothetical protein